MQTPTTPDKPASASAKSAGTELLRQMVRLRLVSARMIELQRSEQIASHASSIGEEAAVVAAALAAREQDWIFPAMRDWGVAIVRGMPIGKYVHHAFGTAEDPAKGHAVPDQVGSRSLKIVPASGVVGAQLGQAVGAAWAAKIRKHDTVAFTLFGEGATSTGDFHNAMNFAGVFKAPVVFICRNNGRAVSTPSTQQTKSDSFAAKAIAYGVASAKIDGTDPLLVLETVQAAAKRAREGKGATLVEVVTWPPTNLAPGGDPLTLGDADPLVRLRASLEIEIEATADDAFVKEIRAEIDAAIAQASKAAKPAPSTMFDDVYAEVPRHLAEEKRSWR